MNSVYKKRKMNQIGKNPLAHQFTTVSGLSVNGYTRKRNYGGGE